MSFGGKPGACGERGFLMNAIEISSLTWKYSNTSKNALNDIHLVIEDNSFTGIVGANGAGKTSLISCIKGIIPNNYNGVYHGSLQLFGKEIRKYSNTEIAQIVGIVFSDPDSQFTAMSVEEEIAFGLENIGCPVEEIRRRLRWVGELTDIENLMEKPPYDLSGGQKQRVAIASVLAMRPKIIILDEPTSMLDPVSKDEVFSLLQKMKRESGLTILVVEHNIEKLIELSDRLLLMKDGEIKRFEPVDSFFDDLAYLRGAGIKIPGIIEFMQYVQKDRDGGMPVQYGEILRRLEVLLKKGELENAG